LEKLFRFGLVGATGFAVDACSLALLLYATPLNPFVARIFAMAIALATTWLLNRNITFGPSRRSKMEEAARYGSIGIAGSAMNYALYASVLVLFPHTAPIMALFIASVLVTVFSWFGYSRFVFQK
jgi:putative flippase GtrA